MLDTKKILEIMPDALRERLLASMGREVLEEFARAAVTTILSQQLDENTGRLFSLARRCFEGSEREEVVRDIVLLTTKIACRGLGAKLVTAIDEVVDDILERMVTGDLAGDDDEAADWPDLVHEGEM